MQIEIQCSNCGKTYPVRPMVGIPHGLFSLGFRAVGEKMMDKMLEVSEDA